MIGTETAEKLSVQPDKQNDSEKKDDLIEISILGVFNDNSIVNIENEFQEFYSNLQGNEIEWRGYTISFYLSATLNEFEINFKTKCKFESVGEKRAEILEYIHELGGSMGEIQSSTLVSL